MNQGLIDQQQKRQDVSKEVRRAGKITTDTAEKTKREGPYIPFKRDDQQYFLCNVSHRDLAVKSEEASFRILGVFGSTEEAIEASADFPQDVELMLHPIGMFKYIGPAKLDPEDELRRIQEIYDKSEAEAVLSKERFDERMSSAERGEPAPAAPKKIEEDAPSSEEVATKKEELGDAPERIRRIHELRGQRYAAIGLLLDGDECCFNVFSCFEEVEECERYVVNTLSDEVRNYDLHVVDMYEWLFPFQMKSSGGASRVGYRHVQLNDVMTYKAESKDRVEAYRSRCAAEGLEPSMTEIDETGVISKSTLIQQVDDDEAATGAESKE